VQIGNLSNFIWSLRKYVPAEFQRKPRRLNELHNFKATEFRFYLLYFGPYVFRNVIRDEYYQHFLLFHFAFYTFASSRFKHLYHVADRCLQIFVKQFSSFYSRSSVVYNVHILLHMYSSVVHHGPLDEFSSFPFENYLSKLKRRIKASNCVFEQTVNQLLHVRTIYADSKVDAVKFSTKMPNNYALTTKHDIVMIKDINGDIVSGKKLEFVRSLYTYPYDSRTFDIGFYRLGMNHVENEKILTKVLVFPHGKEFLVIPFC